MVLIMAFVAALVATRLAMTLAWRTGLMDHPGELKIQEKAIPYLGGLGVAAGLAVGAGGAHPALLLPLGLALALGIVDDARPIAPGTRLAAQVVIGLAAAAVMPVRLPGALGLAAVVLVVIVLVNGVNMIDGLDGLAAGVALTSALGFAVVLNGEARTFALALACALGGFLVFNRPPARVYLGDGGAYLVGAALAVLLAMAWYADRPLAVSIGSLPLVALPAAELGFAVLRRFRSGSRLLAGDRGHIYDQLVDRGRSRVEAAGAYAGCQAVLAVIAVGTGHLAPVTATVVAAACAVSLLSAVVAFGFLTPTSSETTA